MRRRRLWVIGVAALIAVFCPTARAVADDPVAAACSSDQRNLFTQLARSSATMTECAVAGPYALIGFQNAYAGVTALLTQDSAGEWHFVDHAGGQITPKDMTNKLPAMPAGTARSLYALAASQDNSQLIRRSFSADPNRPLHANDLTIGERVQSFNGLFVDRLIYQTSSPNARACLRSAGHTGLSIRTYDSGAVEILGAAGLCSSALNPRRIAASGFVTSRIAISAERVLGAVLARERFNADPRYAKNDRDLSHYDVVFWDKDGKIHITFQPAVKPVRLFVGCPPVGATVAGFIINPATFALKPASTPC